MSESNNKMRYIRDVSDSVWDRLAQYAFENKVKYGVALERAIMKLKWKGER